MKVGKTSRKELYQSIKFKLLIAFSAFSIITFSIALAFFWLDSRQNRIADITKSLTRLNLQINDVNNLEKDFFSNDAFNKEFYATGKSDYLRKHTNLLEQIKREVALLRDDGDLQSKQMSREVGKVTRQINSLEKLFEDLVLSIRTRGFKDKGLEGEMRKAIYRLEVNGAKHRLSVAKILTLRRHEKDYIIRKENEYVDKLLTAVVDLQNEIKAPGTPWPVQSLQAIICLVFP